MNSRRRFVTRVPVALLGAAAAACRPSKQEETPARPLGTEQDLATPGAPPTFGTMTQTGPEVSPQTFAEAEKLVQVTMTEREREQMASSWRRSMAAMLERRTGPRTVALAPEVAPGFVWNPVLPGVTVPEIRDRFQRSSADPGPLPSNEDDIAYAPVTQLSRWIETKKLSAERLTRIYLDRIERFDGMLKSVITLRGDRALEEAKEADAEIASGKYRGPLHGIPWGAKDLVDTAGVATTYGAEPFQDRVPETDAPVVSRLREGGAILLAKLSLGALALNDIWFGGQTMNPWLPEEGASGSSAGPGAAMAAALVAFTLGSETGGSIISPAMRCGVTGLRPTFGRVPRSGAMTLCWSLDKVGPMTRTVEDAMLVLQAISGPDAGDVASVTAALEFDAEAPVTGLRVGYISKWIEQPPSTDVDRAALEAVGRLGMTPVPVELPDWPYSSLMVVLFAEAAASFEELTLGGADDTLTAQVPDAWPNMFRQSRFLSAVDFVQADRMRRRVALEMARIFSEVDVLLVPSLRDEMLTIGNFTGHPSVTLRTGFVETRKARSDWAPDPQRPLPEFSTPRRVPHGVTLVGRLFDEGTVARVGMALEREFPAWSERPPGF
jgi:Asp-tRNA(Asn)/Glu-tRNA(Gln) amidotransferase A subunit family amidase